MLIIKDIKRIDYSLKDYLKKVNKTKILDEFRSKKEFKKKSQIRREKIKKARYKNIKHEN